MDNQTIALEAKLRRIIIPAIIFDNVRGVDALKYLDDMYSSGLPNKMIIGPSGQFELEDYELVLSNGKSLTLPHISLNRKNISMLDAFDTMTKELGIEYQLSDNGVLFSLNGVELEKVIVEQDKD